MRGPNMRKFLAKGVALAKRRDVVNTALRYNPLYYGRVARLLRDADALERLPSGKVPYVIRRV